MTIDSYRTPLIAMLLAMAGGLGLVSAPNSAIAAPSLRDVRATKAPVFEPTVPVAFYSQPAPNGPLFRLTESRREFNRSLGATGFTRFRLSKFNPDGSLSRSFGSAGHTRQISIHSRNDNWGYRVVPLPDGRIAVLATMGSSRSIRRGFGVVMFLPTGQLDSRFASGGILLTRYSTNSFRAGEFFAGSAVAIGNTGIALCGGISEAGEAKVVGALLAFGLDGKPMPGFGTDGVVKIQDLLPPGGAGRSFSCTGAIGGETITATYLHTDRLASNDLSDFENRAIRITASGALDPTYGILGMTVLPTLKYMNQNWSGAVEEVVPDRSGRTLIQTMFTHDESSLSDVPKFPAFIRLNPDGSVDRTFGNQGIAKLQGSVTLISPQGNGSIIVGGSKRQRVRRPGGRRSIAWLSTMLVLRENGERDRKWSPNGYRVFKNFEEPFEATFTVRGRNYYAGPRRISARTPTYTGPKVKLTYVSNR